MADKTRGGPEHKSLVARPVNYQPAEGDQPQAAVISGVNDDETVTLTVFLPDRDLPLRVLSVKYSRTPAAGCWSLPEHTHHPST